MKSKQQQSAFTLVELLIVIIVIALLATIVIVAYNGLQNRAKDSTVKADLNQAAKQLAMDKATNGDFPTGSGTPPSTLKSSDKGTTYEYTSDGETFCLSGINGDKSAFHITQAGDIKSGVCPGHSGPVAGGGGSTHSCDTGYIRVPGDSRFGTSDFCVMKYEAKNVGGKAVSQADGFPWASISQINAIARASEACSGCHLITEAEWMTIVANVLSVSSNWSGGSVGSGYIYNGHANHNPPSALAASADDSDGLNGITGGTANSPNYNNRRTLTLSNGEVIWDLAGNVYEWTNATIPGGQQPGPSGQSGYAYRQWNNSSLQMNGLPAGSRPSAISSAVAGYGTTQGIGQLHSSTGETDVRAYLRGGPWNAGSGTGVLTLDLSYAPSEAYMYIGFRIAK